MNEKAATHPDAELVLQSQQGRREAFDLLVGRHYGLIYVIALGRLGNEETARDLTQEVFLRAFLNLPKLRDREKFAPWIAQMARNLRIEWLRRRRTASRLVPLVFLEGNAMEAVRDQKPDPQAMLEGDEQARAVNGAIMRLPPSEREMVLLHYVEELPQNEIAARLGVHPSTITRKLERARARLKQALSADLGLRGVIHKGAAQGQGQTLACIAFAAALPPALRGPLAAVAGKGMPPAVLNYTSGSIFAAMRAAAARMLQSVWDRFETTAFAWKAAGISGLMIVAIVGGAVALQRMPESSSAQWKMAGVIPTRTAEASVVFHDKLWIFGQVDKLGAINAVWNSNNGANWSVVTRGAPFSQRYGHASVAFQDKMWVIGGYDGKYQNDVWSSADGIAWQAAAVKATFPARFGHACVVFQNKLWLVGGGDSQHNLNDVWSTEDGTNWKLVTGSAGFEPRYGHACVVFHDRMWVIGGMGGEVENDIWSSEDGENWTQETAHVDFPARYGHACLLLNNKLWVIAGRGGKPLSDVWNSADGTNWRRVTAKAPFAPRYGPARAVFDNKLWIIGGDRGEKGRAGMSDVWSLAEN